MFACYDSSHLMFELLIYVMLIIQQIIQWNGNFQVKTRNDGNHGINRKSEIIA